MIITWLDVLFFGSLIGLYFLGHKHGLRKGRRDSYQEERFYRLEERLDKYEDDKSELK